MRSLVALFSLGLLAALSLHAQAAGNTHQESYLHKLFSCDWSSSRENLLKDVQSNFPVHRKDDWKGIVIFEGATLLDYPAGIWGFQFFGEHLMRVDVNLQVKLDQNHTYDEIRKVLGTILGPNETTKREGNRRISTWKTSIGGGSGKGEIVDLTTEPGTDHVKLLIHDPALIK